MFKTKTIFQKVYKKLGARRTVLLALSLIFIPTAALAAPALPRLTLDLAAGQTEPEQVSVLLEILFLLTILSLAPAIVLTMTSFTRLIIVFSFLRQAMGTTSMPPTQVLASLAIFLTFIIMFPVGKAVNDHALQPYLEEEISFTEAIHEAETPIREFLFKHTREKDLSIFYSITQMERPNTMQDVPTMMLVAGFMISELKTGFQIGFLIYVQIGRAHV